MRFAPISGSLALWLIVSSSASAQSSASQPATPSQPACRAYAFVQEADPQQWMSHLRHSGRDPGR